jgi:transcriptional regulator with XRE-family HTH domain
MNKPTTDTMSSIGSSHAEAAAERYARDSRYREAHDRLAPYRVIARAVILRRVELRLTQLQLATKLETTNTVISRIESGEHPIRLETLTKLGTALGLAFVIGWAEAAGKVAGPNIIVVPQTAIEPDPEPVAVPAARAVPPKKRAMTSAGSTYAGAPMYASAKTGRR